MKTEKLFLMLSFLMSPLAGLAVPLQENVDFQKEIKQMRSLFSNLTPAEEEKSMEEFEEKIVYLLNHETLDKGEVLIQFLLMWANSKSICETEEEAYTTRLFIGRILGGMTPEEIVISVAPYMEDIESNELMKCVWNALDMASIRGGNRREPDFKPMVDYLSARKSNPPQQLVSYMLNLNPDKALIETRKLYSTPNQTSNGSITLKEIMSSPSKTWWEELYVAAKIRSTKNNESPGITKQLQKSSHKIVRDVMERTN